MLLWKVTCALCLLWMSWLNRQMILTYLCHLTLILICPPSSITSNSGPWRTEWLSVRGRYGAFSVSAVYLQQFPSYSNHNCKIIVIFTYPAFIFYLPWWRPCGNHAKRYMNEKTIQCLPNPSQHVPIYLQQFPSYSNRKCKKTPFSRTAAHIFVSPGDARAAITLNVVWMEWELDAYKLSRSICPSNYNRFWDRARDWSNIVIFSYPLAFDAPVRGPGSRRNSATLFGTEN